jgi:cob(I)alamin adenosyltransferase
MKLYTKTGDNGLTGLIGGTRVHKNDIRIEAYGTIDELNSFMGLLISSDIEVAEIKFLQNIQHKLFTIGAYLATDTSKVELQDAVILESDEILLIETEIDRLDDLLPQLNSFILPGGSQSGSLAHVCRTITRRAERRLFDMSECYTVDKQVIMFINRLSDYFFALSRYLTIQTGGEEIYWKR